MLTLNELLMVEETPAAKKAKGLGLKYAGWGKWADKSGTVVAKSVENGKKLVKIKASKKPTKKTKAKKPGKKIVKKSTTKKKTSKSGKQLYRTGNPKIDAVFPIPVSVEPYEDTTRSTHTSDKEIPIGAELAYVSMLKHNVSKFTIKDNPQATTQLRQAFLDAAFDDYTRFKNWVAAGERITDFEFRNIVHSKHVSKAAKKIWGMTDVYDLPAPIRAKIANLSFSIFEIQSNLLNRVEDEVGEYAGDRGDDFEGVAKLVNSTEWPKVKKAVKDITPDIAGQTTVIQSFYQDSNPYSPSQAKSAVRSKSMLTAKKDSAKQSRTWRGSLSEEDLKTLTRIQQRWQDSSQFEENPKSRKERNKKLRRILYNNGNPATVSTQLPIVRGMSFGIKYIKEIIKGLKVGEIIQLPPSGFSADFNVPEEWATEDDISVYVRVWPTNGKIHGLHLHHADHTLIKKPTPKKVKPKFEREDIGKVGPYLKDLHKLMTNDGSESIYQDIIPELLSVMTPAERIQLEKLSKSFLKYYKTKGGSYYGTPKDKEFIGDMLLNALKLHLTGKTHYWKTPNSKLKVPTPLILFWAKQFEKIGMPMSYIKQRVAEYRYDDDDLVDDIYHWQTTGFDHEYEIMTSGLSDYKIINALKVVSPGRYSNEDHVDTVSYVIDLQDMGISKKKGKRKILGKEHFILDDFSDAMNTAVHQEPESSEETMASFADSMNSSVVPPHIKKAHELGLTHKGRGLWVNNDGTPVARTVNGKLVPITKSNKNESIISGKLSTLI